MYLDALLDLKREGYNVGDLVEIITGDLPFLRPYTAEQLELKLYKLNKERTEQDRGETPPN
jgi:hypothetical protein